MTIDFYLTACKFSGIMDINKGLLGLFYTDQFIRIGHFRDFFILISLYRFYGIWSTRPIPTRPITKPTRYIYSVKISKYIDRKYVHICSQYFIPWLIKNT